MSTLVVGAALGYSMSQIAPFLKSLRRGGYRGDVTLIVDPTLRRQSADDTLFEGVTLVPARQWLPFTLGFVRSDGYDLTWWRPLQLPLWTAMRALERAPVSTGLRRRLRKPIACALYPPHVSRYFHYDAIVRGGTHERILLTDVRDVVFQSDPFEMFPRRGLALGLESRRMTIGAERFNAAWVRQAYDVETLRQLADRPISCSGVTCGDRASILAYLGAMLDELCRLRFRASSVCGIDQGTHNYLLWSGKLGDPVLLESLASPLATLGNDGADDIRWDADGRLVNRDGSAISLVHQYDRWPELQHRLMSRFSGT